MAEKKIEIQMATVGAAEAAAGVKSSADAVKDLTAAQDEATEAGERAATEGKQDIQINQARADKFGQVAGKLMEVGAGMRKVADDFRESDPQLADTLETIAGGLETVSTAATAAATGFMLAGTAGAAMGVAVSVATTQVRELYEAYVDLMTSMADRKASFETMAEAEANSATVHEEIAARRKAAGFKALLEEQTEAARNLAIEMAALEKVEAASGKLDTAKKNRDDFERIQSGEDSETVRADRALWDAEQAKSKIEADLDRKKKAAQQAALIAETADSDAASAAASPGLDPEVVAARRKAAEAAKEKARVASREYDEANTVGDIEKAAIEETAAGKVAKEQAALKARRQREAEAQNRKDMAEMLDNEEEDAKGGLDSLSRTAAGKFGDAAGRAPNKGVGKALDKIGDSLSDGTNAAEIEKLQQQFAKATAGLGGATVSAMKKMLAEMEAQAKKIAEIDARTKGGRPIGG